jgi:hypothetical protein
MISLAVGSKVMILCGFTIFQSMTSHVIKNSKKSMTSLVLFNSDLTILDFRIVETVGEEDPPKLGNAVGVRPVVVLVVWQRSQQVQLDLLN